MRTQLHDLKNELQKIEYALALSFLDGLQHTDYHRFLRDKKYELIDTINNIR